MMKGQFLLNGILAVMIGLIIFVFVWYPVVQPIIDGFVVDNPDADPLTVTMMQLLSFVVVFAIVLSVISFINPPAQQQQFRRG